jgi:phosphoribosylaminoimidazole-succinocarboxamide synthase
MKLLYKRKTKDVFQIEPEFEERGLHLADGMIEVGKKQSDGKIMAIDEISTSVFRACKGFSGNGRKDCAATRDCIQSTYKNGRSTIKATNLVSPGQIAHIFWFYT